MNWPHFLRVYDEKGRPVRVRYPYLGLIVAAVALIGVTAVYVPIAMTSTPSFCENCHLMQDAHALWQKSTHANVNCVECHVDPGVVATLVHKMKSYKEIWSQFFGPGEMPSDVKLPSNAACEQCHRPDRLASLKGDIKIPHEDHLKRGLKCADCHFNVVHTRRAISGGPPPMDVCYMCHDGKQAPNACSTCHTTPQAELEAQGHPQTANILETHGKLAQNRTEDCARCHSQASKFCENCHNQRPASHQATTWRYTHNTEVQAKGRDVCFGCHKQDFCDKCHTVHHPPDWAQSHAAIARGGYDQCLVCHSPGFCNDCHTKQGVNVSI